VTSPSSTDPASDPGLSLRRPIALAIAAVYGQVAASRRRRARRADATRRLRQPVVSVGNLSLGGTGKTPVVAHLAALLRDAGERPAVLSRGYARTAPREGVVVVRDAVRLRADLPSSGDEPLMLARALDGVAVVVAEDRHLAGVLAEARLGATVHVLDDGFQHVGLARDVDLVLVDPADVRQGEVVPAGRLREPVDAARHADAWLVPEGRAAELSADAARFGLEHVFEVRRRLGVPRMVEPWNTPPRVPRSRPVAALAGIATPQRFFEDLEADGWQLVARLAFRDHHPFTARDVERVALAVRGAGAELLLTTEKDVMRLLPLRPLPVPVAWVPLSVEIFPVEAFRSWLAARLEAARRSRRGGGA
jgi:tetraacyldisaccharide 4'-kinase